LFGRGRKADGGGATAAVERYLDALDPEKGLVGEQCCDSPGEPAGEDGEPSPADAPARQPKATEVSYKVTVGCEPNRVSRRRVRAAAREPTASERGVRRRAARRALSGSGRPVAVPALRRVVGGVEPIRVAPRVAAGRGSKPAPGRACGRPAAAPRARAGAVTQVTRRQPSGRRPTPSRNSTGVIADRGYDHDEYAVLSGSAAPFALERETPKRSVAAPGMIAGSSSVRPPWSPKPPPVTPAHRPPSRNAVAIPRSRCCLSCWRRLSGRTL
jgi:hypothetical protein